MKIKIDVTKSIYEQSWWPSLKPEAKLKVLEVYKSTEWLHRLSMRRGKRISFLYKPNKETKNETT